MLVPTSTSTFNPRAFLAIGNRARGVVRYARDATIYTQGTLAHAVYYLQEGKLKLSVTSPQGKEAIIAIVQPGAFFGEGCLIGQERRLTSAVAMVDSEVTHVGKAEMLCLLREDPAFDKLFTTHLLMRNSRIEADLVDQLFNSSEKRLARALLLLANVQKDGRPQPILTKVSHETLAEMVGTTRPRVSHFMTKFRKLGFISRCNGSLQVHSSLLSVLLRDTP
jgi:CRP/FNR family transcriptional regulator, cyclic AMP receptor protein